GASLYLAYIRQASEHPERALPLLKRVLELNKNFPGARVTMAEVYRKIKNWTAALAAADAAIAADAKDGSAHFNRPCALARLGRPAQAIAALKRAIELDADNADLLEDEDDLTPLAHLAAFKALIPKEEPMPPAAKPPAAAPAKPPAASTA